MYAKTVEINIYNIIIYIEAICFKTVANMML